MSFDYNKTAKAIAKGRIKTVERRGIVVTELLKMLHNLVGKDGGDLIDLGSGTGDSLFYALKEQSFNSITCVDSSKNMIAESRKLSSNLKLNISYIVENIETLKIEDNSCDYALMNSVIHHLSDLYLAFSVTRKLLRPGGGLGIYTLSREQINDHHLVKYFPKIAEINLIRYPEINTLSNTLNKCGFNKITVKAIEFEAKIDSNDYFDSIIGKYGSVLHLLSSYEFNVGVNKLKKDIKRNPDLITVNLGYLAICAI